MLFTDDEELNPNLTLQVLWYLYCFRHQNDIKYEIMWQLLNCAIMLEGLNFMIIMHGI